MLLVNHNPLVNGMPRSLTKLCRGMNFVQVIPLGVSDTSSNSRNSSTSALRIGVMSRSARRSAFDLNPSQGPFSQSTSPPCTNSAHSLWGYHSGLWSSQRRFAHSGDWLAFGPQASRKRGPPWRILSRSTASNTANNDFNRQIDANNDSKDQEGHISSCSKCASTVSARDFFCEECGAAQLLDGRLDYFQLFGIRPSVFMDLKHAEKKFKDMQRAFHPDLFASKGADEQAISAANSATVNKAYQTLVRPMSRVKYLMRILGSTALEEEGGDDRTPVPPAFLMEIMETRESLEQCSSKEEAEAKLSEASATVGKCLREMDEVLKAGGGKDELADAAVRLRYLNRIEDEARSVMHRLDDERTRTTEE